MRMILKTLLLLAGLTSFFTVNPLPPLALAI
jgi:hypothetical protein